MLRTLVVDPAHDTGPTRSGVLRTYRRLAQSDALDPKRTKTQAEVAHAALAAYDTIASGWGHQSDDHRAP
jgi:hypothetical protein